MDPITTAVLAALPAIAAETVKSFVKDAYDGLKEAIHKRWGAGNPVSKAITAVEQDPKSPAQAAVLEEKVKAANASADPDVAQALQLLLERLKARGIAGGASVNLNISGGTQTGVIGAGAVNAENITFGRTTP